MILDRRSLLLGTAALAVTPASVFAAPGEVDAALGRRLAEAINTPAPNEAMLRALLSPRSLERRPAALRSTASRPLRATSASSRCAPARQRATCG